MGDGRGDQLAVHTPVVHARDFSEYVFQHDLQDPGKSSLSGDLAEVVLAENGSRAVPVGLVEEVDELDADVEILIVSDASLLLERQVPVEQPRAPEAIVRE